MIWNSLHILNICIRIFDWSINVTTPKFFFTYVVLEGDCWFTALYKQFLHNTVNNYKQFPYNKVNNSGHLNFSIDSFLLYINSLSQTDIAWCTNSMAQTNKRHKGDHYITSIFFIFPKPHMHTQYTQQYNFYPSLHGTNNAKTLQVCYHNK